MDLLETINAAKSVLPDIAQADASAAQARMANPNSAIFDELKQAAAAQGKKQFTFLGRLVPVEGKTTFQDVLATLPKGELEDASAALAAQTRINLAQQGVKKVASGEIEKQLANQNPLENILSNLSVRATKAKGIPVDELANLRDLANVAVSKGMKGGIDPNLSVLQREALKKFETAKAVKDLFEMAATSKPSVILQGSMGQYGQRKKKDSKYVY
jgi:hypothetical protein